MEFNCFYVLGGDDGQVNLSSLEVYSPQRKFLNNSKSYISCVVIGNLN